ncbi:hypothetical protein HD554DRAFT_2179770 [Boletus coccyginus]|nr:hypothetical protein HD554DRAFT_2179770 [Boletus coccyginus]
MARKSIQSPSKGASSQSHSGSVQGKTYEVVSLICGTSGFAYTLDGGAGIGAENEDVWNEFMKKYKDAGPFRNKGWPHYEAMKNLMPSKGKGLNRFSALTISTPSTLAGPSVGAPPTSESDSGGGSIGTVGAPSTVQDTLCMVSGASLGYSAIDTDAVMATVPQLSQPSQLLADQVAHPPFGHSVVPSYPVSTAGSAHPSSTSSGHTNMTFGWRSDLNAPPTPTSFAPPTAPSSFNSSSISSVKPSSSISARMEQSLKRKGDDDDHSVVSSTLSTACSTSSARKRRARKGTFSCEQLGEKFEKLENMCESISDQSGLIKNAVSALDTKTSASASHPIVQAARKKLVELDATVIPPSDVVLLFKCFHDNHDFADGYLQLMTAPELAAARQAWLKDGIELCIVIHATCFLNYNYTEIGSPLWAHSAV